MDKRRLGPQHLLNPKPVVLLGTIVDEKPNFLTVSWIGSASANPPAIVVAVRNMRYSLKGIRQHRTFSLSFPTVDMAGVANYCGSVSGATVDKVKACSLTISAGSLRAAPLIEQCPINMECEVLQFVEIGDHTLVVGTIRETYVAQDCLVNETLDIEKLRPLCYCSTSSATGNYYCLGEVVTNLAGNGDGLRS